MKIFKYLSCDVQNFFDSNSKNDVKFDQILLSEWNRLMNTDGIFKFRLETPLPTRILTGKYQFVVQASHFRRKKIFYLINFFF